MYAVIATGGKQYRVAKDDIIDIERIEGDAGKKVSFDEVLVVGEGDKIECGTPLLKSAKVDGEIVEQFRGKKLVVFKMKRRKGWRRKQGHRQELTKIKIGKISAGGAAKVEKKTEAKPAKADDKKAAPAKETKAKETKPKVEKKAPAKKAAKTAEKKAPAKKAEKKADKELTSLLYRDRPRLRFKFL